MNVQIKSLSLAILISSMSTGVSAAQYWLSSNGTPVRDSNSGCVKAGFAANAQAQPGCDAVDRVILLPGKDGEVGAVVVTVGETTQKIDSAYSSVLVGEEGGVEVATASEQEVSARFGQLIDAQPLPQTTFTVRFLSGSATELTPESEAVIQQLVEDLDRRDVPEVRLVGHTDTVGALSANDRLSSERAQTVADILSTQGIPLGLLEVTGRGEREPATQTADNVDEPGNRRVDITVR